MPHTAWHRLMAGEAMTTSPPSSDGPLLSQRTALILVVAIVAGVIAGVLLILAATHPANATISGVVAFAATVAFLNKIIE
ncbi:hypothetical protein [Streptomyces hainanensis]|uniref:Uncharacterized protein n=1 Tax=Streptomyces hainanensis TaxID=402648 RepID=A0A4R4TCW3_9ACTN|nr:hypothetical protein [Streptomyces hainanensis]TDC73976.1 hypothetical protein E1283_17375 [Streptomyces hainanensis]